MSELLMSYFLCMLENIALMVLCGMFLHQRKDGTLQFLPAFLVTAGILHVMQRLGLSFHIGRLLLTITVDVILLHIYYRDGLLKKVFLLFGFLLFSAAAHGLAITCSNKILKSDILDITNFSDPFISVAAFLYLITLLLFLVILERFRIVKTVPLSNLVWLCLLSIPLISLFAAWYLFPFGDNYKISAESMRLIKGISFFLLLINYLVFALYRTTATNAMLKQQHVDMHLALDRERTHYSNILSSHEMIRDQLHDYLKVLNFLSALLTTGQVKEAIAHLGTLIGGIRVTNAIKHTGNLQMDALLSQKISEFQLLGIELIVHGRLPGHLNYNPLDLCILIGNALDNAAQACSRQKISGKCIDLSLYMECKSLLIEISNISSPPSRQNTLKKDKHLHGRGLEIMRRVAEKYNGSFIVQYKDGRFIVSVLLQEPKQVNKEEGKP